jgi:hypothetical protein
MNDVRGRVLKILQKWPVGLFWAWQKMIGAGATVRLKWLSLELSRTRFDASADNRSDPVAANGTQRLPRRHSEDLISTRLVRFVPVKNP